MTLAAAAAPTLEDWFSVAEAAAELGVGRETVRRWIADGLVESLERWGMRLIHRSWLSDAPAPADVGRRAGR